MGCNVTSLNCLNSYSSIEPAANVKSGLSSFPLQSVEDSPKNYQEIAVTVGASLVTAQLIISGAKKFLPFCYRGSLPAIATTLALDFGFTYLALPLLMEALGGDKIVTSGSPNWFVEWVENDPMSLLGVITQEELLFRVLPLTILLPRPYFHMINLASAAYFSYIHINYPATSLSNLGSIAAGGLFYGTLYRNQIGAFGSRPIGMAVGLASTLFCHVFWDTHCYLLDKYQYN